MDVVVEIYRLTEVFPQRERYGLTSQLRSSSVSVPANIAEGRGRLTDGEWCQFLGHARGSLLELETEIFLAERLRMLGASEAEELLTETSKIGAGITHMIDYVRRRKLRKLQQIKKGQ